jgi:hypothetical protein
MAILCKNMEMRKEGRNSGTSAKREVQVGLKSKRGSS